MDTSAFACTHVCVSHRCCVHGGQQGALDPFKLQFRLVVNYHADAWNRT